MKKMLTALVLLALVAGTAVGETVSDWKPVRAAVLGTEANIIVEYVSGDYNLYIEVTTSDPDIYGIASFGIGLIGATTIVNESPQVSFLNFGTGMVESEAGFALAAVRSGDNVSPVAGAQNTLDTATSPAAISAHRVYGLGQFGGDLEILSTDFPINKVQTTYGAPLLVASGDGSPTLGEKRVMIFVPEPATMSLLGLGGVFALLRRRR